jgi:plastocyanin
MRRLAALAAASTALVAAAPANAATIDVKITKSGFSPSSVRINFGDTVKWTNSDSTDHQIVADNGSFASPILKPKATYSFTFKTAGRFPYHDAIKPSLKGVVRVNGPPPSLTFGATNPIVVYGTQTTLNGTVSNTKANESVTLFYQPYGQSSPIQLAVVKTTTGGVFSFTTTPTIYTTYWAQWHSAKSQQAVVQVKPKITFTPKGSRFYTTVSAADHSWAGHFVYLQRLSRFGQWVTTLKLKLGPKSARLFRIPRRHGVTVYRVAMTVNQAGPGYLDSHSGTQKVRRR